MADQLLEPDTAWDANLSTGVCILDEQHIALFVCLRDLKSAAAQKAMLATFHAMEQLSRYVKEHFSAEEHLMSIHDYPWLTEHRKEHRIFCDRLFELRKTYLEHDISADLIDLLRDWLEQHVAKTDMKYVPYLNPNSLFAQSTFLPGSARVEKPQASASST